MTDFDFDPGDVDADTLLDMLERIRSLVSDAHAITCDTLLQACSDKKHTAFFEEHRNLLNINLDKLATAESVSSKSLRVFRAMQETSCFSISLLADAAASSTCPSRTPGASAPPDSTEGVLA